MGVGGNTLGAAIRYHVQDSGHCCPVGVRPQSVSESGPRTASSSLQPTEQTLRVRLGARVRKASSLYRGQCEAGPAELRERGMVQRVPLGLTNPAPGLFPGISPLPPLPSAPRASLLPRALSWAVRLGSFHPVSDGTVMFSLMQQCLLVFLRTDTVSFHSQKPYKPVPITHLGPSLLVTSGR